MVTPSTSSLVHAPISAPGAWLGLLGGGQLGRMFCAAAQSLGYRVLVLDPDPDSPAGSVADAQCCAAYDDPAALAQLAARCVAVTTEFENVPAAALQRLAESVPVRPGAAAVAIAQDRIREKNSIAALGIAVAPYASITSHADLKTIDPTLLPGRLKAARLGYDGRGQYAVDTPRALREAFEALGGVPCVLERHLSLAFELSLVLARDANGQMAFFPAAENHHHNGILRSSRAPAPSVDPAQLTQAESWARLIAEALDYVGVLCVEFFVLKDGSLCVNEIAPRPHNSGHYTLNACVTSQFEQQVRALVGLPLGSTRLREPSLMLNLLGEIWFVDQQRREPDWSAVLALPGTSLHLYGKNDPRPGRKMGHITCTAPTAALTLELAQAVSARLGLLSPLPT